MSYFLERETKFLFGRDDSFPRLAETQKQEIESYWKSLLINNSHLFNGRIYCCNGFRRIGRDVIFSVNRSDYKTYKWAKDHHVFIPGAYTMGNCVFLFDRKIDSYVFLRRGSKVAFDRGKISGGAGGVIDFAEVRVRSFSNYLLSEAVKELEEEVAVTSPVKKEEVEFVGAYLNDKTLNLELAYRAFVSGVRLAGAENIQQIVVKRGSVTGYFAKHAKELDESAYNHLLHIADYLDN